MKFDSNNRPYYIDHNSKSTTYNSPPSFVPKERLPRGWEVKCDSKGRPYYIDHNTRSTSYQAPV